MNSESNKNQNSFTFGQKKDEPGPTEEAQDQIRSSQSSINTNELTDMKRSETEDMNNTRNHYISINTSKTLMGPDILSPKVRQERPADLDIVQGASLQSSRETFDEQASKKVYKVKLKQPSTKQLNVVDFERLQYQNSRQQEQLEQM